jgi:glutathione S-transferase
MAAARPTLESLTRERDVFHIFGSDYPTRHIRVQHAAGEMGCAFDIEILGFGRCKDEDFLKHVQPNGWWPGVVYNGFKFSEATSALQMMFRKAKTNLFPEVWDDAAWATHFDLAAWTIVTLDARIINGPLFDHSARDKSKTWFQQSVAPRLEEALGDRDFINGDTFSATDIYVAYTLYLADRCELMDSTSKLSAYLHRIKERPHFKAATERYD